MKLIDGFYGSWKESYTPPKILKEDTVKVALKEGYEEFSGLVGYRVPLWRLNKKNKNNRIYTTAVAEEVIQMFSHVSTVALFDHDTGKPSTTKIAAVAKNPQIIGEIMYIDVYIVDADFEIKLKKILMLGSSLGVSSVFDGDIRTDGTVYDLVLDRWCDLVMDPSYEVFIDPNSSNVDKDGKTLGLTESTNKIKEGMENVPKEKLVKSGITELNLQFGKLIEDAKSIESLDAREKKILLIESYIAPEDESSLTKVVEAIDVAKTEIAIARKIKEDSEKEEANNLKEKFEKSEKELLEENTSLKAEVVAKNNLIKNIESLAEGLKETNKKQKEILEAVEPDKGENLEEVKLEDDKDKKIEEPKVSDTINKPELNVDNVAKANTAANLQLLEDKKAEVANLEAKIAEASTKKGTFLNKECKIIDESEVDGKKVAKIQLVDGDVVLDGVALDQIEFKDVEPKEEPKVDLKEGNDALANELAVSQAALKKSKEEIKLLRSQLEKKEDAPVKDPAFKEDATVAKESVGNKVKIKESTSLDDKRDPKNMDHFDESVANANKGIIEVAVNGLIEENPGLAPYKTSLMESTTLDSLHNSHFKIASYLSREALKRGTSLKESTEFKESTSYGYGDNAVSLEDLGM